MRVDDVELLPGYCYLFQGAPLIVTKSSRHSRVATTITFSGRHSLSSSSTSSCIPLLFVGVCQFTTKRHQWGIIGLPSILRLMLLLWPE